MITEPAQAQAVLAEGRADLILLARVLLREPYWPVRAAVELGRTDALGIPPQYDRGWNTLGKWEMDRGIAAPMNPI
jgi:2,4-dienoyl-CoA reductase-like NADH-dependent reductase (Old Yellow Enzyme family)